MRAGEHGGDINKHRASVSLAHTRLSERRFSGENGFPFPVTRVDAAVDDWSAGDLVLDLSAARHAAAGAHRAGGQGHADA